VSSLSLANTWHQYPCRWDNTAVGRLAAATMLTMYANGAAQPAAISTQLLTMAHAYVMHTMSSDWTHKVCCAFAARQVMLVC
jgi:hypothetical protein